MEFSLLVLPVENNSFADSFNIYMKLIIKLCECYYMLNDKLNSYSSSESYRKGKIRFAFLFLIVFVAFGNEYAFNNPQALE